MARLTLLPHSVAVSLLCMGAAAEMTGDPKRGEQVFKKCASWHVVGADACNRAGPRLNYITSARAAADADFKYSKAMRDAATDGLHWTAETLDAFLQVPKDMIPRTRMTYCGLMGEADRSDLVAYLATFSGGSMAARVDAGFTVPAVVLGRGIDLIDRALPGRDISARTATPHGGKATNEESEGRYAGITADMSGTKA